jgi:Trypsin
VGPVGNEYGGTVVDVVDGVLHPDWSWMAAEDPDLAVLKLKDFLPNHKLVRLNTKDTIPLVDQPVVFAMGFGLINSMEASLTTLLGTELPYIDDCSYISSTYNRTRHLCADARIGATCGGDSGAPITLGPRSILQVGINSYSNGQCESQTLDIYTRVSYFIPWIQQQICDLSSQPPPYCITTNSDVPTESPTILATTTKAILTVSPTMAETETITSVAPTMAQTETPTFLPTRKEIQTTIFSLADLEKETSSSLPPTTADTETTTLAPSTTETETISTILPTVVDSEQISFSPTMVETDAIWSFSPTLAETQIIPIFPPAMASKKTIPTVSPTMTETKAISAFSPTKAASHQTKADGNVANELPWL